MQYLAPLTGTIKHYDWGGTMYIPSLLQIENPNMQPYAEYWLGVHPQSDCKFTLNDSEHVLLRDFIQTNPAEALGPKVLNTFGNMPYLLKVLDVKNMLSIQVHPSKEQAAIDFERENQQQVPLDAPHRNYKDANHKPELMVAMSDFYLLHGFKPEDELLNILERVKELKSFIPVFKKGGYKALYKKAMEMPQQDVNKLLRPLLTRIIAEYQNDELTKADEHFWAARASLSFNHSGVTDRGIFSIYFFNLLQLKTGQAIFQNAGVPHAYLEGRNVEIMANSDNVLRGGLTTKYVDTAELLKHTKCEGTRAKIIKAAKGKSSQLYKTPVKDFCLTSWHLKKGERISVDTDTAEIFLLLQGAVSLRAKKSKVTLQPGSIAAAAFSGATVRVDAAEDSWLFKASAVG